MMDPNRHRELDSRPNRPSFFSLAHTLPEIVGGWVTVPRATQCYTRVQMNIDSLLKKLSGSRPSRRVVDRVNLGCWHPSTTDIHISSLRDSHPVHP